jgi:hypothetical protein
MVRRDYQDMPRHPDGMISSGLFTSLDKKIQPPPKQACRICVPAPFQAMSALQDMQGPV